MAQGVGIARGFLRAYIYSLSSGNRIGVWPQSEMSNLLFLLLQTGSDPALGRWPLDPASLASRSIRQSFNPSIPGTRLFQIQQATPRCALVERGRCSISRRHRRDDRAKPPRARDSSHPTARSCVVCSFKFNPSILQSGDSMILQLEIFIAQPCPILGLFCPIPDICLVFSTSWWDCFSKKSAIWNYLESQTCNFPGF